MQAQVEEDLQSDVDGIADDRAEKVNEEVLGLGDIALQSFEVKGRRDGRLNRLSSDDGYQSQQSNKKFHC